MVADRYENLVGAEGMTPDRAIVQVLRESATILDPVFSRVFANALGVFPVGCLVRLSDHSVGVVSQPGEDPLAPIVRLAFDQRGNELAERPDLDLSLSDVRIVEVLEAEALNVRVSDKL